MQFTVLFLETALHQLKINVFASSNPPFVLSGIPLSGQPGFIQEC